MEGATELYYLNQLWEHLRALGLPSKRRIRFKDAGGHHPEHVVQTAVELFDKFGPPEEGRVHYVAVFDTEYPDPEKRSSLERALDQARAAGIGVCVSHPCFEVWLHCHRKSFRPCGFNHRKVCVQALDDAWKKERVRKDGYAKAQRDVFERLRGDFETAIQTARDLRETHHAAVPRTADANASTDVYRLVEFLRGERDAYETFEGRPAE